MDAVVIAGAVRMGNRRAIDVVNAALRRATAVDHLGAFIHLMPEHARKRAREIDALVASNLEPGRLAGVPIAIKDNIAHEGHPLTAGSRFLDGNTATHTSTALQRLEDQGAIVIGRTNMDEFGMGSSGEHSSWGPTRNPIDPACVPGGSSSGSAAAVAAGVVPIALGSDTGGSVRQPASFCGVVGLKPTYGRISRHGLVAFASSLDQIGPLTRSIRDAAVAVAVMAGVDPLDSTSLQARMVMPDVASPPSVKGLRIGMPRQAWSGSIPVYEPLMKCLHELESRGAVLVPIDLPSLSAALPAYYVLSSAEAASNLARYDGIRLGVRQTRPTLEDTITASRTQGFGPEVQRRLLLGTYALSEGLSAQLYSRAAAARTAMRETLDRAFSTVDVIATPTAPCGAFPLGTRIENPSEMYTADIFTIPPSLSGHPALSVPASMLHGKPIGLQLIGPREDEAAILKLGMVITGR